jgi:hypothetical protein
MCKSSGAWKDVERCVVNVGDDVRTSRSHTISGAKTFNSAHSSHYANFARLHMNTQKMADDQTEVIGLADPQFARS